MNAKNLTVTQLRILVAIDDTASFTAAADKIGLTQPAVSHAIRTLEIGFGVALFDRRRAGVWPTAAGRAAVAEARKALFHVEQLHRGVKDKVASHATRLRLGCFPSAMSWGLSTQIVKFNRQLPDVVVEIEELADATCIRAICEGDVDLGMVNLPCPELDTFPLFEDELCVVIPSSEGIAQDSIDLRQLASRPFVFPRGACGPLIEAAFISAGVRPPIAASVAAHGPTSVLAMVRQGAGFTILPAYALAMQSLSGLRVIHFAPALVRRVAFAAISERLLSSAAHTFLQLTLELRTARHESFASIHQHDAFDMVHS